MEEGAFSRYSKKTRLTKRVSKFSPKKFNKIYSWFVGKGDIICNITHMVVLETSNLEMLTLKQKWKYVHPASPGANVIKPFCP